jgi:hypothetical protein
MNGCQEGSGMRMTRRIVFGFVLALMLPVGAFAQETFLAFYLVPKIGTGAFTDPFRPKYIGDIPGALWSAMDLGIEPTFIVGANLTAQQHTAVAANGDVFVFPDITTAVGGNPTLNRARNGLEQRNVPGSWIVAATTWRQVIGEVGRNCLILQRLNGIHKTRLFPPGVSLDSAPTQAVLDQLIDVGESFGLNVASLSIGLTVRDNLLLLTSQIPSFTLAGEVF